ncbi:hypothetical protein MNBD_ALPHA05-1913, partial [hydrothermal vent metagenome]
RRDPQRQFVEADAAEAAVWRERFAAAAEDWRVRSPDNDVLIERFDEILAEIRVEADAAPDGSH